FPYADLVETNRLRSRGEREYELIDTGVFDGDRYFDVFVEYAKAAPEDLLIEIAAFNRGPEPAALHLLPTLWFRNTWQHGDQHESQERPLIRVAPGKACGLEATTRSQGKYVLRCPAGGELLFVENETNPERWRAEANGARGAAPAFF